MSTADLMPFPILNPLLKYNIYIYDPTKGDQYLGSSQESYLNKIVPRFVGLLSSSINDMNRQIIHSLLSLLSEYNFAKESIKNCKHASAQWEKEGIVYYWLPASNIDRKSVV